jgi:EmrB/QacA subfamily drug resistance transporter
MTISASTGHSTVQQPTRPGLMLVLLSLAQFMVVLDVTVVNVALPEIGAALALDRATMTWVVTAYTMSLGGLLILGGRLADRYGARTTFLVGLALFTSGSLSAGLSTSGEMLLTSRVLQGVGAALLSPGALSLLLRGFTGRQRNRALAVWGAIGGAGAAAGVLLGGVLTSGPGWEWAFFVNVPVGAFVMFVARVVVPAPPGDREDRLDVPGAVMGSAVVTLAIYALTQAGDAGWRSASALVPGIASILVAALFVFVETRVARPLISPTLFKSTNLAGGVAVMGIGSAALVAAYFLTSIYLQHVQSFSPLQTGFTFLPSAMAVGLGAHAAGHAIAHIGPRLTGCGGLALAAVGLIAMGWASGSKDHELAVLVPGFLVASVGIGLAFVTATMSGLAGVRDADAGLASGVMSTGHEIGASVGVAVASSVAAASLAGTVDDLAGFRDAYFVAAAATLVVAVAVAGGLLPRERTAADDLPTFLH